METKKLNEIDKGIIIKSLESQLNSIESQLTSLNSEKRVIEALLNQLRSSADDRDTSEKKRESLIKGATFTWKTISIEILKDKRRILTTDEIYNEFVIIHPDYAENKKRVQASFSSALSQLSEKGEIVRIERKYSKGNLWALPEWFNEVGSPLPEIYEQLAREHREDFIYNRQSEDVI